MCFFVPDCREIFVCTQVTCIACHTKRVYLLQSHTYYINFALLCCCCCFSSFKFVNCLSYMSFMHTPLHYHSRNIIKNECGIFKSKWERDEKTPHQQKQHTHTWCVLHSDCYNIERGRERESYSCILYHSIYKYIHEVRNAWTNISTIARVCFPRGIPLHVWAPTNTYSSDCALCRQTHEHTILYTAPIALHSHYYASVI